LPLTTAALVLAIASPRRQSGKPARAHARRQRISFPNSGNAAAQAVHRGVLLLTALKMNDTAAEAFRQAQAAGPGFALAYWGRR
jgi:hypothetical protein